MTFGHNRRKVALASFEHGPGPTAPLEASMRKRALSALAAPVAALLVGPPSAGRPASADDWPEWRGP